MNAWVIHRNVNIFGPDANDFNPDRWLDSDAAANMDKYMFAFGGGSRTCIGRNFAMAAMSKLVPEFLRQFEIELADPKGEMKFDNHWYRTTRTRLMGVGLLNRTTCGLRFDREREIICGGLKQGFEGDQIVVLIYGKNQSQVVFV